MNNYFGITANMLTDADQYVTSYYILTAVFSILVLAIGLLILKNFITKLGQRVLETRKIFLLIPSDILCDS